MKVWEYIQLTGETFQESDIFYGHGTDNAVDEAVYLVCASLDIDFHDEQTLRQRELTAAEYSLLDARVHKRVTEHTPVAYLTGKAWFAGHAFHSDARALVPRSPIAELIHNRFAPLQKNSPDRVLDLCTGSGCIGIAAALEFAEAEVVLADISTDCQALANANIALHKLQGRVHCIVSDVFTHVEGRFDLILCNPPYVSAAEINELPQEYRQEPELGLLSADDGLQLPLQILREASEYLSADGLLVMEVGYSRDLLEQRLPQVPLLWMEFEYGGDGVFAITSRELQQYRAYF